MQPTKDNPMFPHLRSIPAISAAALLFSAVLGLSAQGPSSKPEIAAVPIGTIERSDESFAVPAIVDPGEAGSPQGHANLSMSVGTFLSRLDGPVDRATFVESRFEYSLYRRSTASSKVRARRLTTLASAWFEARGDRAGMLAYEASIVAPSLTPAMQWQIPHASDTVFVAPMMKVGVDRLTSTASPGQPESGRFAAAGLRIGHSSFASYVDISAGRWQEYRDPARVDINGRTRIPFTPFSIGAEVNAGHGAPDVRIYFATVFDMAKLMPKSWR